MKPNLKTDTVLYGAATMVERVLGLVLLPLLTRHLTAAEYGIWAQSAVVSSVLMPVVLFCMPAAIVRFFAGGLGAGARRAWMMRTLAFATALFAVLGLAAWLARDTVAAAVYGDAAERGYVAVLVTLLAADALFDLLIAYLRAAFRMRSIGLLLLARGGVRLGFLALALGAWQMPFARAFALLAALQLTIVIVVFGSELMRRGSTLLDAPDGATAPPVTMHALLAFAAPLVLVSLLTSANGFSDRFVLTHLLGLSAVAVYAAIASLVSITGVAYTVLGFTLFPVLARLWSQGETERASRLAADVVRVFLFMALPVALWLPCVAGSLMPMLTTQAYRVPAEVVLLLGIGAIGFGLYQIVLYLLLLAGKGLRAAWLMLLAALLNLALNLALVPHLGLTGAALAAALSNFVLAMTAYATAHRHAGARFPWASALRLVCGAGLAAVALLLLERLMPPVSWPLLLASVLAAAIVYLAFDLAPGRSVMRAFVLRKALP